MSFTLQQLKQLATEGGAIQSKRSVKAIINDYVDAHPALRGALVEIANNRDNYRRGYDQQRHIEDVIHAYDRKNGNKLDTLGIEPSRLIEYVRDRVNYHLLVASVKQDLPEAPRILRGRIASTQLIGPVSSDDGAES
jgi:hypothetical protein